MRGVSNKHCLLTFFIKIDTIESGCYVIQLHFIRGYGFLSLKIASAIANSAILDEITHTATFHLGLHCLTKYPFRGYQYSNG